MPVDKLHSEYRSTYRWHEYTGPRQEIIRKPPQSQPQGGVSAPARAPDEDTQRADASNDQTGGLGGFEPALPRRKKNPALAYKTHEFLAMSDGIGSNDSLDASVVVDRARMIATVQPSGGALKCHLPYKHRVQTAVRLAKGRQRAIRGQEHRTSSQVSVHGSYQTRRHHHAPQHCHRCRSQKEDN